MTPHHDPTEFPEPTYKEAVEGWQNCQARLRESEAERDRYKAERDWMEGAAMETVTTWNFASQHTLNMMCEVYRDGKVKTRKAEADLAACRAALVQVEWWGRSQVMECPFCHAPFAGEKHHDGCEWVAAFSGSSGSDILAENERLEAEYLRKAERLTAVRKERDAALALLREAGEALKGRCCTVEIDGQGNAIHEQGCLMLRIHEAVGTE